MQTCVKMKLSGKLFPQLFVIKRNWKSTQSLKQSEKKKQHIAKQEH